MTTHRPVLVWPFMLALTFLFALSITAPRTWETVAQRTPLRVAKPGVRTPLNVAAPSLLVHDMAAAEPAPRTAAEFAPPTLARTPNLGPSLNVTPPTQNIPTLNEAVPTPVQPSLDVKTIETAPTQPAPATPAAPNLNGGGPLVPLTQPTAAPAPAQAALAPSAEPIAASHPAPIAPPAAVAALPVALPPATLDSPRLSGVPSNYGTPAPHSAAAPLVATPSITAPSVSAPTVTAQVVGPATIGRIETDNAATGGVVPTSIAAQPTLDPKPELAPRKPQPDVVRQPEPKIVPQPEIVRQPEPAKQPEQVAVRPVEPKGVPHVELKPEPIAPKSWWPEPTDLYSRLDKLRTRPETRPWAERADAALRRLAGIEQPTDPAAVDVLDDLRTVAADPVVVDESRLEPAVAVELRLARHALLRRVDVWESLTTVLRHTNPAPIAATADQRQAIETCLVELERHTDSHGETGRQWRNYLMVDALRQTVRNNEAGDRRTVAREIVGRIRRATTGLDQNEFLRHGPFAKLDRLVRGLAEPEIDPHQLLVGIERFEQGGLPSDGRALAEQSLQLGESSDEAKRQLAVWLTSHYRSANVRVTFSEDMVNRLLPDALKRQQAVNDTILGLPTRGWGTSRTGLSAHFVPSRDQLTMRLEAQGIFNSQTRTNSGPVRVFNHSNASFAAQKQLSVTADGIKVEPATALSNNRTKLRGVESDFDHVPILGPLLLGPLASNIATDKHDENKTAAQREAAWKLSRNIEQSLDHDVEKHLKQAGSTLQDRIAAPLQRMKLQPEIVDLQTLEDRATIRLRIAGDDQLAANTPRPRAYSDNVVSVQMHQSAINNMVDRLSLQSRRCTPEALYDHVITQLNLTDRLDTSKLPPDVEFQFAATDPLTLRFDEGAVELRLALDELKCSDRTWTNFVIRVQFKPQTIDGRTYLVRDGVVRLSGPQLRTTHQISLRTVCAKVFPDDMRVVLWPDELREDPRFADLDIEQIDIRDGWLGLSIGPRRQLTAVGPPATPVQR